MFWRIFSKIPVIFWIVSRAAWSLAIRSSSVSTTVLYTDVLRWRQRKKSSGDNSDACGSQATGNQPTIQRPDDFLTACVKLGKKQLRVAYFQSHSTDANLRRKRRVQNTCSLPPSIALNLLKVCKKNILLRPVFAGNAICPQKCIHLVIKVCQFQVWNPYTGGKRTYGKGKCRSFSSRY